MSVRTLEYSSAIIAKVTLPFAHLHIRRQGTRHFSAFIILSSPALITHRNAKDLPAVLTIVHTNLISHYPNSYFGIDQDCIDTNSRWQF